MSTIELSRERLETDACVAAATGGDHSAFSALFDRYRRELHGFCYRMLGSHEECEDVTQETFLRAWHKRESFRGDSSFRSWLYRIASNTSLTALERRQRARRVLHVAEEVDSGPLVESVAAPDEGPDADVLSRETDELAFLVAIQRVPARQRTVLSLRDVLGWSARDTAELLDMSPIAVNSSLYRARATLRKHLLEHDFEWAPCWEPSADDRALLRRYVDAAERADAGAFAELLDEERHG
jgi:RNA polymerase sigma-70 factor, ECF subfamily